MNYLSLVNLVLQESGNEMNDLDLATWSSAEAGRRLYPRIKRYVAQAWKEIQMERNQWVFMTGIATTLIQPAVTYTNGNSLISLVGRTLIGEESGFSFVVASVEELDGALVSGDGMGVLYFTSFENNPPILGETFTDSLDPTITFTYAGPGSYKLAYVDGKYEVDLMSFAASNGGKVSVPVAPMPWENWRSTSLSYSFGTEGVPTHFSENEMGRIVFYPTINNSFTLAYAYAHEPQALVLPTDTPNDLPEYYHEWIAWRALMKLADFDKNTSLFSHARKSAIFYRNRAETNLMPRVAWKFPEL